MPDRLQQIVSQARKPWVISLRVEGAWQTAAFGWAIGVSFGCLGWLGGWHMKLAQVYQHYSPAELEYLDRLWQMNSDTLIQCQEKRSKTCSIRLTSGQ
jgi:hypothetical protein